MKDKKLPQDSTDDVLGFSMNGVDIDSIREAARMEAARIWGVPTNLVRVMLSSIGVAARDPFPTDLSTYASVHALYAYAKCIRVKDPDMPEHDVL